MMNKSLFSILIAFLYVFPLNAQETLQFNWQHFTSPADGLEFDCPFAVTLTGVSSERSPRAYSGGAEGTWIFVFSSPPDHSYHVKGVDNFLKAMGQTVNYGKSHNASDEVRFRDKFGYWQYLRAFKQNDRYMLIQVISQKEKDQIAIGFLNSIQFSKPRQPSRTISSELTLGQTRGNDPQSINDTQPTKQNIASSDMKPPISGSATPVKITSKRPARYNEWGRTYMIRGIVALRVPLLASGEIGKIDVVRSLPFGLDEMAVAAAKKIKFEPATENGIPIDAVKLIEYSFSIY